MYETVPETVLGKAEYFEPVLSGRIGHAVDESGAFFIDRDGILFGVILQWLRTYDRPSQCILEKYGDALLEECRFYGEETLPQIIRGELAPSFYLKHADRMIVQKELDASQDTSAYAKALLFDVHSATTSPRDRMDLEQPLILCDRAPQPSLVGGFDAFYARLDAFTNGLLAELRCIPDLVFAGGAVLAALTGGRASDLDIFLICDPKDGETRLREIYAAVQRVHATRRKKKQRYMATRSRRAVTFYLSSVPADMPPIQVITATHTDVLDVLLNFDLDCCCFAYAPSSNGERVVCTPRGLRALVHGVNVMDGKHAGSSYAQRLEKYSQRGFAVAIPGYRPERVSPRLLAGAYGEYPGHDVLFKLGQKDPQVATVQPTPVTRSSGRPLSPLKRYV